MNKHTPGPWKWGREWKRDEYMSVYDGSIGNLDPDVLWFGMDGEEGIYCPVEANAHLIAAAPEMLTTLKDILNSDMAQREEDEGRESNILSLVRRAIAKAEGRE